MPLSNLDRLLWAVGLCGHLLLLGVLFGRRRAVRFPFFTTLIAASVLRTLTLFVVHRNSDAYALVYMGTDGLDVLLQLAVVYEVAWHTFRPLGRWAPDARRGMAVLIGGSLLIASLLTWLSAPGAPDWRAALLV